MGGAIISTSDAGVQSASRGMNAFTPRRKPAPACVPVNNMPPNQLLTFES